MSVCRSQGLCPHEWTNATRRERVCCERELGPLSLCPRALLLVCLLPWDDTAWKLKPCSWTFQNQVVLSGQHKGDQDGTTPFCPLQCHTQWTFAVCTLWLLTFSLKGPFWTLTMLQVPVVTQSLQAAVAQCHRPVA